jgi:hypothetical protein
VTDTAPKGLFRARLAAYWIALAGALVCLYSVRQADPDFFGYLAYGRLLAESGSIPAQDPFAYTSTGFHWVSFEYGAQLLLWWTYHYGGPIGLIALKCVLGGATLALLYVAIRTTTDDPFVWMPTFLLSTSAVSRFFVFRPQLFTFACFALFVAVLFRFLLRGRAPLWILPLSMIVWTNAHGGFVAGLGAVGLVILLRVAGNLPARDWSMTRLLSGTSRLWMTLAGCVAATFVNPFGARLWGYVLSELAHGTNRQYIAEWRPVSFKTDGWSTIVLALIAISLFAVGWVAHRKAEPRMSPRPIYWVLSCVPLMLMACASVRHVPLAAIWTAPVITLLAAPLQERLRELATFRRVWFLLRGLALLPACLTMTVVYAEPRPAIRTGGKVLGVHHPCGAVAFIRDRGYTGNLYNPLWWGGYVTWELYPQVRVSMDGRNISLFSDTMVLENLKFYTDPARDADITVPLRYPTDLLIVPANAPVLSRLRSDPHWRLLYADRDSTLFQRADAVLIANPVTTAPVTCDGVLE